MKKILRAKVVHQLLFFLLLFAIWMLLAQSNLWPSYLFPSPLDVGRSLITGFTTENYLEATLVSLKRLFTGYAISLVIGMLLGLAIGRIKIIHDMTSPLLIGLQALPSVCWLPLSILWFGLTEQSIIFVVVMGALFSITLGVESGIRNIPPLLVNAGRNLGAQGWRLAWYILLPAALPTILHGLKQGWTFAWRSLMAAELVYYSISLGNLLQTGRDLNDAAMVVAVMLIIITIGVCIDQFVFSFLEKRIRTQWGLNK